MRHMVASQRQAGTQERYAIAWEAQKLLGREVGLGLLRARRWLASHRGAAAAAALPLPSVCGYAPLAELMPAADEADEVHTVEARLEPSF